LSDCRAWCQGLDDAGLAHARRALRVSLPEFEVSFEGAGGLVVLFTLPAGSYATMALRELINFDLV